MTGAGGTWWRFLPPGPGPVTSQALEAAASEGQGALSRALRAARAALGAVRTARMLAPNASPGRVLRLLLAAPIQPQALVDALTVAFAIAGLSVEIEAVEGLSALRERVDDSGDRAAVDVALLLAPPDGNPEADAATQAAAHMLATRLLVPVALAGFGRKPGEAAERPLAPGLDRLALDIAAPDALDRRFSGSFGTILAARAADNLADAVAGWAARLAGVAPKLLLTDLDGTLWTGILGERAAGEGAPPLNRAYAEALAALGRRGLVLGVASRNEPADVEGAFASGAAGPLASRDIAAFAVGWEDKARLVERALAALGLGADHAVLVDDDPVNCAKVAARFPGMDVRLFAGDPGAFAAGLLADPLLLGGGAEAGRRAERYRAKAGADRLKSGTPDIAAFLAALETRLTFEPLRPALVKRAAELAARVNQFILDDTRPNVLELSARASPFDFMVRLDDAFGAHGLVGLVLASPQGDTVVVDNLVLSCRALERGVEDAMLRGLAELAARRGLGRITGRLDVLPRNAPARLWLARAAALAEDGTWTYRVPHRAGPGNIGSPPVVWVSVEGETMA